MSKIKPIKLTKLKPLKQLKGLKSLKKLRTSPTTSVTSKLQARFNNNKVSELNFKDSITKVKDFLKQKAEPTQKVLISGKVLMYKYNAKDKTQVYDRTPLTMVLSKSNTYMLGLNLHWCPYAMRKKLIDFFIKINRPRIKQGLEPELNYHQVKPVLARLGFYPVIRLYIRKRMSAGAIVVPTSALYEVIRIKSETFTGKAVSAEQLYKRAVNQGKKSALKKAEQKSNVKSIRDKSNKKNKFKKK